MRNLILFAILCCELSFAAKVLDLRFLESKGATSFRDSSGNGNTGTCSGGTCPAVENMGKFNRALVFDGGDDVIDMGNPATLQITGSATLAAWITVTTWPGSNEYDAMISKTSGTTPFGGYQMNLDGDSGNKVACAFNISGTWRPHVSSSTYSTNRRLHFVCTYDGSDIRLFVNGESAGAAGSYAGSIQNVAQDLLIGENGSNGNNFTGQIHRIQLWDNALSRKRVAQLYRTQAFQYANHSTDSYPFKTRFDIAENFIKSLVHFIPEFS